MFCKHTVRLLFFDYALVLIAFLLLSFHVACSVIIRRFEEMIMWTAGGCTHTVSLELFGFSLDEVGEEQGTCIAVLNC